MPNKVPGKLGDPYPAFLPTHATDAHSHAQAALRHSHAALGAAHLNVVLVRSEQALVEALAQRFAEGAAALKGGKWRTAEARSAKRQCWDAAGSLNSCRPCAECATCIGASQAWRSVHEHQLGCWMLCHYSCAVAAPSRTMYAESLCAAAGWAVAAMLQVCAAHAAAGGGGAGGAQQQPAEDGARTHM